MSRVLHIASPHHSSRYGHKASGTVIHYTAGGSGKGTANWFAHPDSKVSAHWVICRNGVQIECVPEFRAAWHAEPAEMPFDGEMQSDVNELTIGVELANHGWLIPKNGHFFYKIGGKLLPYGRERPVEATLVYDNGTEIPGFWEPFSEEQIDSLQALLKRIADAHGAAVAQNVMGHDEIAVPFGTRKRDPGPLFPWGRISRKPARRTWKA